METVAILGLRGLAPSLGPDALRDAAEGKTVIVPRGEELEDIRHASDARKRRQPAAIVHAPRRRRPEFSPTLTRQAEAEERSRIDEWGHAARGGEGA
jgi:hypothetical protein